MVRIDMQSTIRQAERQFASLGREIKDKAIVRALNDTLRKANTQSSREIKAQGYNLKVSRIKQSIRLSRATRTQLKAVMRAMPDSINLKHFSAKQVGKNKMVRDSKGRLSYATSSNSGVRVKVKGASVLLRHAFIGKNGLVFEREQGSSGNIFKFRGGFERDQGKIKPLSGVPVSKMMKNDIVWNALTDLARDHFPVRLRHHLQRALR